MRQFQSPQWGKCSKEYIEKETGVVAKFQSPQWGKCSKEAKAALKAEQKGFSPRNGESVLKTAHATNS